MYQDALSDGREKALTIDRIFKIDAKLSGIPMGTKTGFFLRTDSKFFRLLDFRATANNQSCLFDIYINEYEGLDVNVNTGYKVVDIAGSYSEANINAHIFGFEREVIETIQSKEVKRYYKTIMIVVDNATTSLDYINVKLVFSDLDV